MHGRSRITAGVGVQALLILTLFKTVVILTLASYLTRALCLKMFDRGKDDIGFVRATHTGEKSDSARRQQGKRTVWPSENELEPVPEIGCSHLPSK